MENELFRLIESGEWEYLDEKIKSKTLRALGLATLIGTSALSGFALKLGPQESLPKVETTVSDYRDDEGNKHIETQKHYNIPELASLIEKHNNGHFDHEFIEAVAMAESRAGENMKFDSNGSGLMQVSDIALQRFNEKTGSHYTRNDLKDHDINMEVSLWSLKDIQQRLFNETGSMPSDEDIYLAYNVGVKGFFRDGESYKNNVNPKTGTFYNGLNNFNKFYNQYKV